jgi:hypothetical protein
MVSSKTSKVGKYHSTRKPTGLIDMQEFQAALGFSNSIFAARIFHALDEDSSETLEFSEFVRGFFLLSTRASKSEKIQFTFKIYDVDGNGDIDKQELLQLLTDVIREDGATKHLQLSGGWFAFMILLFCNCDCALHLLSSIVVINLDIYNRVLLLFAKSI